MNVKPHDMVTACAETMHEGVRVRRRLLGEAAPAPFAELDEEAREVLRNRVRKILIGEELDAAPDAKPEETFARDVVLSLARSLGFGVAPEALAEPVGGFQQVARIKRVVAEHFGFTAKELDTTNRESRLSLARHVAMFYCRLRVGLSYTSLGKVFGHRDHTTARNAYRRIEATQNEAPLRGHLEAIERALDALETGAPPSPVLTARG